VEYNLVDLFESVVDVLPADREAVVEFGEPGKRLTYRELDARANRLAHHLIASGLTPGAHVAIQLTNRIEYVEALVACLKARVVPLNVNYRYVEDELLYLFNDADIDALIVSVEFADRVAAVRDRVPTLKHIITVGGTSDLLGDAIEYEAALAAQPDVRDGLPQRSQDDLYIIYTGGTTGMPKGVMWRQEDIFFSGMGGGNPVGEPVSRPEEVAEQAATKYPLVMFPTAPLMHGAAQLTVWIAFQSGNKVVLLPKFDGADVVRAISKEKVNTINLVGDAMATPIVEALNGECKDLDVSSWLATSSAGAILSQATRDALKAVLPNMVIIDSFGATEVGFMGSAAEGSSPDKGLRFQVNKHTLVIDDDHNIVEPGSGRIGRVALRGHVPVGYYGDEEKTKATFITIDGHRHVILGDLGRPEADGTVSVLGRAAAMVNTGGEKVFPEEVEAAVKAHPDVRDVVVCGVPDPKYGERVAAVVQLREGAKLDEAALAEHTRTRVAGYKVPRVWVEVGEVLRSPSGKPDYPWAKKTAAAAVS
jgi:acyl-CoA synthetase (AMP-forming)/AMP-acid ligase II